MLVQNEKGFDLEKPAFGEGSEPVKVADVKSPEPTPEATPELKKENAEPEEVSEEKPTVKYSRFKSVNERRLEAERQNAEWRTQIESLRGELEEVKSRTVPAISSEPSARWLTLYGDNEQSRAGWKIWQEEEKEREQALSEKILQRLSDSQAQSEQEALEREKSIDESLEELSTSLGRELTEAEQIAVLDIQDEYTPKGNDGKYLGALLPAEKAWEIYELKNESAKSGTRSARKGVAAIVGAGSAGEPSIDAAPTPFNSGDRGGWRRRLGLE